MIRGIEVTPGRKKIFWPMILLLAVLSGCIHSFSKDVLTIVEKNLTYPTVIQNPKAHIGSIVLWGGIIEKTLQMPGGTQLIVTETPLDSEGYPEAGETEGEFIAHTSQQLDLKIFHKDTKVTVAGEIDGVNEGEQGPMGYPRPMVRVIEIRAWVGKAWGIFPITRGWEVDQYRSSPPPFFATPPGF